MKHVLHGVFLALSVALLSGCGGDDNDGGSSNPGGGASAGGTCQTNFTPGRVAAGENCAPVSGTFCTAPSGVLSETIGCAGVTSESWTISGGGLSSSYIALYNPARPPKAIYLALHYLAARAGTFANIVRLPELAKARDVLVLVPQAPVSSLGLGLLPVPAGSLPAGLPVNLASRWPTSSALEVNTGKFVQFLDAVVADARTRYSGGNLPLYVAGLSNGAEMTYLYACQSADHVEAIMAVAGALGTTSFATCAPTRPIGSVIVHGTSDPVSPYGGRPLLTKSIPELHTFFRNLNGCGAESPAEIAASANDPLTVTFGYTTTCNATPHRGSVLVTIQNGGHNWPGQAGTDADASSAGLFGLRSKSFDATLQGYDLLRHAAAGN